MTDCNSLKGSALRNRQCSQKKAPCITNQTPQAQKFKEHMAAAMTSVPHSLQPHTVSSSRSPYYCRRCTLSACCSA
eukprot:scaffold511563_cov45-Prasinocladus_malaysianus.AAC.1